MGTSGSSKGSSTSSPLVPDYAVIDGQGPVPAPGDQRFRTFRTHLGKFVSTGSSGELRSALGHFARTSTGGSSVGPRRFGAMARSGGALLGAMASLPSGAPVSIAGVNLSALDGADTDVAIQEIVRALTPANGDAEKISFAMQTALAECLEGLDTFDFSAITQDMLISMLLAYVRECVFAQIMMESNRAFQQTEDVDAAASAEQELHELVKTAVDSAMTPLLTGSLSNISNTQVENIQITAIREVWKTWEGYE